MTNVGEENCKILKVLVFKEQILGLRGKKC